jgi:SET domain
MDLYRARLRLQTFHGKGRGLVAIQDLAPEELIERAPVFVVPVDRFRVICDPENSLGPLKARMVIWKKDDQTGEDIACIAFGLLSFCNHDGNPNARFEQDYETETLALIATRTIAAGEEITIRYRKPDIIQIGDWGCRFFPIRVAPGRAHQEKGHRGHVRTRTDSIGNSHVYLAYAP